MKYFIFTLLKLAFLTFTISFFQFYQESLKNESLISAYYNSSGSFAGFIQTEMTEQINEEFKKSLISKIPSGTLGKAEDVSNCVVFLASEMSKYINGETLHVNGGMYMS